jgi:hypothetical protein
MVGVDGRPAWMRVLILSRFPATTRVMPKEGLVAGNSADAGRSVTSKITAILVTFTEGG